MDSVKKNLYFFCFSSKECLSFKSVHSIKTDDEVLNVWLIIGAALVAPIQSFPGIVLPSSMCLCWYSCSRKVCVCIILKIMCMIFFFILFMTISSCFPFAYSFCVYALIIALCSIVALMPICTKQLVCGSVLMMYRIVYQKMQYYSNMRICMDYRTS